MSTTTAKALIYPARRDRAGRSRGDRLRNAGAAAADHPRPVHRDGRRSRARAAVLPWFPRRAGDGRMRRPGPPPRRPPDPRRRLPARQAHRGVLLRANSSDQPGGDPPAGDLRLGQGRAPVVLDRRQRHREIAPAHRPGHPRGGSRLPGPLHPRVQTGQRARRSRRRQAAVQDHHPLRPRRSDLPGRAGLYGTRPPRRRTALPGTHRARRAIGNRHRLERAVLRRTKTFTDPRLCAAIVDRLTFAGQIIETGTTSYRLAHARKRRTGS